MTIESIAEELQVSAASLAKWRKEQGAATPRGGQSALLKPDAS
jgi:DNA-binding transcriptional regulator YiaG